MELRPPVVSHQKGSNTKTCIYVIIVFLTITYTLASEPDTKPTREQIIKFLDVYRKIPPLTWEEIRDGKDKRETINLIERFGTDFSGLDLSGIDFCIGYGKSLQYHKVIAAGADFSRCNMRGVAFYAAELANCNFSNADLTHTAFWSCKLQNADFSKVRLRETKFSNSNMQNVLFSGLNASACAFH
ncbi:MAG: pentapeptide repeat-containing protein [Planctomycetaceae bacterium]|nr:pentapeptide repeat-containing protein [Planctomycetaceae bacterium]